MRTKNVSLKTAIHLSWRNDWEARMYALANYEDRNLKLPVPPLPKYVPVVTESLLSRVWK